jgi:hypothetical protein
MGAGRVAAPWIRGGTDSSRAAASASCPGRGRDTSLARIAALSVTFMLGMGQVCAPGPPGAKGGSPGRRRAGGTAPGHSG